MGVSFGLSMVAEEIGSEIIKIINTLLFFGITYV